MEKIVLCSIRCLGTSNRFHGKVVKFPMKAPQAGLREACTSLPDSATVSPN